MKQVSLFGIPCSDIEKIYVGMREVPDFSLSTITRMLDERRAKYSIFDTIRIRTKDKCRFVAMFDGCEVFCLMDRGILGEYQYRKMYTNFMEVEESENYTKSKHTDAFFNFFGF